MRQRWASSGIVRNCGGVACGSCGLCAPPPAVKIMPCLWPNRRTAGPAPRSRFHCSGSSRYSPRCNCFVKSREAPGPHTARNFPYGPQNGLKFRARTPHVESLARGDTSACPSMCVSRGLHCAAPHFQKNAGPEGRLDPASGGSAVGKTAAPSRACAIVGTLIGARESLKKKNRQWNGAPPCADHKGLRAAIDRYNSQLDIARDKQVIKNITGPDVRFGPGGLRIRPPCAECWI